MLARDLRAAPSSSTDLPLTRYSPSRPASSKWPFVFKESGEALQGTGLPATRASVQAYSPARASLAGAWAWDTAQQARRKRPVTRILTMMLAGRVGRIRWREQI